MRKSLLIENTVECSLSRTKKMPKGGDLFFGQELLSEVEVSEILTLSEILLRYCPNHLYHNPIVLSKYVYINLDLIFLEKNFENADQSLIFRIQSFGQSEKFCLQWIRTNFIKLCRHCSDICKILFEIHSDKILSECIWILNIIRLSGHSTVSEISLSELRVFKVFAKTLKPLSEKSHLFLRLRFYNFDNLQCEVEMKTLQSGTTFQTLTKIMDAWIIHFVLPSLFLTSVPVIFALYAVKSKERFLSNFRVSSVLLICSISVFEMPPFILQ